MSLEPQAGAQNGLPVENPTSIISIGERSLMDVWRVLMKQRLIVVAVTLLSVAGAAWHAFRTPPVYQTSSRIEIKSNSGGNGPESFWAAEDPTTELQTEVEVIKSDTVLFQAAQSINLIR
ncbi:MAG: Wzz/FepE/Etk N-terminal domain-containing protein, partial [Terracidiphilus sp.]